MTEQMIVEHSEGGHRSHALTGHTFGAPSQTILAIRANHRERMFAMEQRKRANLALGAYLRTQLGWRLDLPEKERKAIANRALALIKAGEQFQKHGEVCEDDDFEQFMQVIVGSILSRAPFDEIEKRTVKDMADLAKQLPVWVNYGQYIRGFGAVSLACIVGEAGSLGDYDSHSKLWKRMGLAVMNGVRQGCLKKGSKAEEWIEHGYSAKRRSQMFVIGDVLIKTNRDGVYRQAYDTRKAYEIERCPDMTKMQAHRRAQRYMEKKLLRDLWKNW